MKQPMSLERMLADLMADEASGGAPDHLIDQIHSTTNRSRQLPRWLAVLKEPPMLARSRIAVGIPTRQLVLIGALLLLGAALAIGLAASLLLRPSPPAESWPGFRGDATRAGTAVSGPVGNPVVRWQFHAQGAIDADIAVAGGLVIAPSDDGVLHALDVTTGAPRWTLSAVAPMNGPFVADGRVFVADGAGIIHAISLADGKPIWTALEPIPEPADLTVAGNVLVVGSQDGTVVGMRVGDGTIGWRTPLGTAVVHAPAATAGGIAIATDDLDLAVLEPATGAIRWRIKAGVERSGTPVILGDTVYIGGTSDTQRGRLSAHDLATGRERWRIDQDLYAPSISGAVGYTGSAIGRVTAVDLATGSERWIAQFDGAARAPAVTANAVFVAVDRERRVVALDTTTGGELWSLPVDGNLSCCIAAAEGLVFVGTSPGTVYAIGGDGATLTAKNVPSVAPRASATATPPAASVSPSPEESLLPAALSWTATAGSGFNPWGLAQAPNGDVWASLARDNRFAIFTRDGRFVETWGTGGTGDGEFDLRRANGDEYGMLAFARDGSFFVLDVGNRRVQAFDAKRKFLKAWGSFGSGPGQFNDPVSIAIDADGNVNVLDDVRQVIEIFTPRGKVVRTVPAFPPGVQPNDGANQVQIGPNGHIYVSVVRPNLIAELDRDGALIRTYGDGTKGFSFTEQPNRIAFDEAGRMYVTQGPERRGPGVAIFDPDGTYLGGFGAIGSGPAEMTFPWGLVVAKDGIYVTDALAPAEVALKKFGPVQFP